MVRERERERERESERAKFKFFFIKCCKTSVEKSLFYLSVGMKQIHMLAMKLSARETLRTKRTVKG